MRLATTSDHRRFWPALAFSVLLHTAFLAISRSPPVLTNDRDLAIDLRLWVDAPGEQLSEHDTQADVLRAPTASAVSAAADTPESEPDALAEPAAVSTAQTSMPASSDQPAELPPLSSEANEVTSQFDDAVLTTTADVPDLANESIPTRSMPAAQTWVSEPESELLEKRVKDWSVEFLNESKLSTQKTWRKNGQQYVATLTRMPATDDMQLDRVQVLVTTIRDGQALTTRMQMKRLAFSHFAQLIDFWDKGMQLHDDEIYGRFHSNSEIFLGWDNKTAPRFFGLVTTSASKYEVASNSKRRSRREIFSQGIETYAPVIDMPRPAIPGAGEPLSPDSRSRKFATETQLVFYADGSYGWRDVSDGTERREAVGAKRLYLIAAPGVPLHVRGSVVGRVLIFSPEGIFISGDLTYARDVRRAANAEDYIGLVSDKNVTIDGIDVTGSGDLRVEAAIYARRRFAIKDIDAARGATLSIYGSISAGSLSASEPRFATKHEFDPRFERTRPPGFPMTNRYELEEWDKRWTSTQDP